mgnify:CR=1 FL=1
MKETQKARRGHGFMPRKEILTKIPTIYGTEEIEEPIAYVRYFSVTGWEWYVVEMDPESGLCFGLVKGFETEMG